MSNKLTHKNHGLTEEIIRNLYCVEGMSDREIGAIYGLSDAGVGYIRRKHGIATIKAENRVSILNGDSRIDEVDAVRLQELYRQHSLDKIGEMFGCSKILIKRKLRDAGITILSKHERHLREYPACLTSRQRELMVGSILGDGMIVAQGPSGRYVEYHCDAQRTYLEWKSKEMLPFSFGISSSPSTTPDGRAVKGWTLKTCWNPVFHALEREFYKERVKGVSRETMESLAPLSLAVWYMDDGCLVDGRDYTIVSSFTEPEVMMIIDVLNSRFGFDCEKKRLGDKDLFNIVFRNGDSFSGVVSPHILPCFYYKMKLIHRFLLPGISRKDLIGVNPNVLGIEDAEKIRDYWRISGFPYVSYRKKERVADEKSLKKSIVDLSKDINQGYNAGAGLCLSFFRNFWYAKKNGKRSAMEVFLDDDLLLDCIKDSIQHRGSASAANLRAELQTWGGVHNFRPAVAKAIYDKYCPVGGKIIDPCSGWGGRLLGFYFCNTAERYVGIDASADTIRGLRHMICIVGRDAREKSANVHYSAFEDWNTDERFDLAFTSPPYFNKEVYDSDDKQSQLRYPIYDEWKNRFLRVMIEKINSLLKIGGVFALNVADVVIGKKTFPISEDALALALKVFFLETKHLIRYRSVYTGVEKFEPIYVFRKER